MNILSARLDCLKTHKADTPNCCDICEPIDKMLGRAPSRHCCVQWFCRDVTSETLPILVDAMTEESKYWGKTGTGIARLLANRYKELTGAQLGERTFKNPYGGEESDGGLFAALAHWKLSH